MNDGIAQYMADTLKDMSLTLRHIENLLANPILEPKEGTPITSDDLRPPRDIYDPQNKM